MNAKGIGIALAVLAALVLVAILQYRTPADSGAAPRDPWSRLDRARVDHVTVRRASAPESERTIEFEKSGGSWRMTAPATGPTEPRAVEELVERFADMHVSGIAGRSAQSYDEFEVDDAHAVRVTLKAGASTLLDVFVGASLDNGTAVRVPGRPEIFRVDQSVHSMVGRAPRDWRDRDVTKLEREHVRSVEWVNTHGTFRFDRNGETWSAAAGTAIPRLDTARVGALVDDVINLRATDFADANANSGVTPTSPRVTITPDSGSPLVVRLGTNSGENESYVQREGSPIVFVIGRTTADKLNPDVAAFQAPPPPPDAGAATDAGSAPAPVDATPANMPTPNIPPEVMEQIRRQLQQRGAAPH